MLVTPRNNVLQLLEDTDFLATLKHTLSHNRKLPRIKSFNRHLYSLLFIEMVFNFEDKLTYQE
jgi:hypothetical protein